ncbi:MAG TPA: hypothetical protein PKZ53_22115, partial [Acidobacteriota bacterium]|nr:hypothetical protein [Acidobacteriota bacterium]
RWAACFEAHPPEYRYGMVRARMGAGSKLKGFAELRIPDLQDFPAPIRARTSPSTGPVVARPKRR